MVTRLVRNAGLQDAFAGAYPVAGDMPRILEWLSEPETHARADGSYYQLDAAGLGALLDEVARRVSVYADGASLAYTEHFEHDDRYEVVFQGTGWELARSLGVRVHARLFNEGHLRVVIHTPLKNGTHAYTVAKRSEFVKGFPVPEVLDALAALEPGWGGGSTIGGAPRHPDGARSRLPPERVAQVVEAVVRALR
jgi:hypothetical protein